MGRSPETASVLAISIAVLASYLLAHGATAFLITPVQSRFFPEITTFASLVYLPHGVRILATWYLGARSIPLLLLSGIAAELAFTPSEVWDQIGAIMAPSWIVGATCAYLAFEVLRLSGNNLYFGSGSRLTWRGTLLAGVIASIFNSMGQSIVFQGFVLPEKAAQVTFFYALGDVIGTAVTMLILMMVFRWIRLSGRRTTP
ncbi:MAG: hypothetical protein HUJ27_07760 [Rhodobacteraceae bacterium]|nr:hypothetical protein [Paracoccaceae bacterium]